MCMWKWVKPSRPCIGNITKMGLVNPLVSRISSFSFLSKTGCLLLWDHHKIRADIRGFSSPDPAPPALGSADIREQKPTGRRRLRSGRRRRRMWNPGAACYGLVFLIQIALLFMFLSQGWSMKFNIDCSCFICVNFRLALVKQDREVQKIKRGFVVQWSYIRYRCGNELLYLM